MKIDGMDAAIRNPIANPGQSDPAFKAVQVESQPITKDAENTNQDSASNYKMSEAFIKQAVDRANSTMKQTNTSLEFKIHDKTHDIIVKVIDSNTKEVIREIPSEKILDMVANMLELAGLLVDERR